MTRGPAGDREARGPSSEFAKQWTARREFYKLRYMDEHRPAQIRPAGPGDYDAATALLQTSNLPLAGLKEHFGNALVAVRGADVVGCVAIEVRGRAGLLRSLVVAGSERGRGPGSR